MRSNKRSLITAKLFIIFAALKLKITIYETIVRNGMPNGTFNCRRHFTNYIFNKLNFNMLEDKYFRYDYDKYPLGYIVPDLENMMVEIVKVPRHDFTGTTKEAILKARDWAYCNLLNKNLSNGIRVYHFNKESVNKFTDFTAILKSDNIGIHLAVLKQIENIIFKSIEAELHPDFLKIDGKRLPGNGYNPNIIIHRMFGCAEIDGSFYRIKTTVRESRRRDEPEIPHSFEVKEIEMFDGSLSFGEISDSQHSNDASNISISAAKLLKNVELSYWKGKYFF